MLEIRRGQWVKTRKSFLCEREPVSSMYVNLCCTWLLTCSRNSASKCVNIRVDCVMDKWLSVCVCVCGCLVSVGLEEEGLADIMSSLEQMMLLLHPTRSRPEACVCFRQAGATFSPLPLPSQSSPRLHARPPRSPWPKPLIYIMPPKSELFHTAQSQAETRVTANSLSQLFIQLLSADVHTRIGTAGW